MVQVDVFWSYGIGAGFAMANTRQLEMQHRERKSAFEHTSFRNTLLYLSCLFVPSGVYLIWQFPSWETMHAGSRDLPGWFVAAFAMTNVTQGILGFAIAAMLLRRGARYAAYLQWIVAYFLFFFVLVHGWDGTGYMRFFSLTSDEFHAWTWTTAARWWTGAVAHSLMAMGIVMLPVMFGLMARDLRVGARTSGSDARSTSTAAVAMSLLAVLIVGVLGTAILASVAIRYLGWLLGSVAFVAAVYLLGIRRGGLFHRHFRSVIEGESFFGSGRRTDQGPTSAEMTGPAARI